MRGMDRATREKLGYTQEALRVARGKLAFIESSLTLMTVVYEHMRDERDRERGIVERLEQVESDVWEREREKPQ